MRLLGVFEVADDETENAGDQKDDSQDLCSTHVFPQSESESTLGPDEQPNLRVPVSKGQTGNIFRSEHASISRRHVLPIARA
jgi:hypothetical protein